MSKKKAPHQPGGDMARKIWLAGIGAYGRAFSEMQESLSRVSDETSKHFDDLVQRGEEIEDAVETRGRELAKKVAPGAFSIDERIREMREKLKMGALGSGGLIAEDTDNHQTNNDLTGDDLTDHSRLDELEARLGALEQKIDHLVNAMAAPPKRKTAQNNSTKKKAARKKPA